MHFTVQKTDHLFSKIALDHAHEQNNAIVKGDGGAIGLTESPAALQRWMVSGPEMACLVNKLKYQLFILKPQWMFATMKNDLVYRKPSYEMCKH